MRELIEKCLVSSIRLAQPSSRQASLYILIYHSVFEQRDFMRPNEPTRDEFRDQMQLIKKYFNPVSLPKAIDMLANGELPANSIAVTFDDGYMNNFTVAKPVLDELGIPATFYVSTAFSNGAMMWNDRVIETFRALDSIDLSSIGLGVVHTERADQKRSEAEKVIQRIKHKDYHDREAIVRSIEEQCSRPQPSLMMSPREIKALHDAGYEVAGHTVTHPILSVLDDQAAREEILQGKLALESIIGHEVVGFAYPNGRKASDYTDRDVALVTDLGFKYAVTTHWGCNRERTNPYELMRFTPWDRKPLRFLMRLLMTDKYYTAFE